MEQVIKTMTVGRIEKEGKRLLLYESKIDKGGVFFEYHVVAPAKFKVKVGDQIQYEPYYDLSFGWVIEK